VGGGQGSSAAASAAVSGRAPPATAAQTRQLHPKDLHQDCRTTHLVEIKYCEDTRPEQQLKAAQEQHNLLLRTIPRDCVLHIILLGVGGVIYTSHTLDFFRSLILTTAGQTACSEVACPFPYAHKLVQTRRSFERSSSSQTNQELYAGSSARNPPDPH